MYKKLCIKNVGKSYWKSNRGIRYRKEIIYSEYIEQYIE